MPPPGIIWLIQRAPYLATFLAAIYLLNKTQIPFWARLGVYIGLLPTFIVGRSLYDDWNFWRQARALGAIIPPRPFGNEIVGLGLIKQNRNFEQEYLGEILLRLFQNYGNTISFKLFLEHRIFTTEPEHIKAILATQFENFGKGPLTFAEFFSLLGQGVFNSDGDIWKFHRAMTRPFFAKERIAHFDVFEKHTDIAIQLAKERLSSGQPIDFQDLVFRFTLDSATEYLFGQDVCSLAATLPHPEIPKMKEHPSDKFAHSFIRAQEITSVRSRQGTTWPLKEFWKDQVSDHRQIVEHFVNPIISEALEKKRESKLAGEKRGEVTENDTLLDHLVNCTEDEKIIQDEVLNIMIAGRDTTASTLTLMTYMLTEHPDVLEKLRAEILKQVGPSRRPTFEDIKEMKYLRAVINETLRLYPPVPMNSRTSRKATTFPSKQPGGKPFFVPAGVKVNYSVYLMHRREDLWGPDALLFDPDRFIDERVRKYLIPNPFIFLPFNAGPRICLGQQFAYNEASYFMIRFLQSFSEIEFVGSSLPPPERWREGAKGPKHNDRVWYKSHLTLHVRGNLWMRMKEAKKEVDVQV